MNTTIDQGMHRDPAWMATEVSAAHGSAVSWAAVFAGAAAAASLSLVLLVLGTGLGLTSVSPWAGEGISATTFGISSILWITFMAVAASSIGGYVAGRLRTRWNGLHTDEVYFRDTVHGFLAWGIATLGTATLLGSVVGAIVGGGIQAGAAAAGNLTRGIAETAGAELSESIDMGNTDDYLLDTLFRPEANNSLIPGASREGGRDEALLPEVGRIFMNAAQNDGLSEDDTAYIAQRVAQATGISQQDATERVNEIYARVQEAETAARAAADEARQMSAYASLWVVISLLAGAFAGSLAATYGGRQRDL